MECRGMLLPQFIIRYRTGQSSYHMPTNRCKITREQLERNMTEHLIMLRGTKHQFIEDLDLSAEDQLPEPKRTKGHDGLATSGGEVASEG